MLHNPGEIISRHGRWLPVTKIPRPDPTKGERELIEHLKDQDYRPDPDRNRLPGGHGFTYGVQVWRRAVSSEPATPLVTGQMHAVRWVAVEPQRAIVTLWMEPKDEELGVGIRTVDLHVHEDPVAIMEAGFDLMTRWLVEEWNRRHLRTI